MALHSSSPLHTFPCGQQKKGGKKQQHKVTKHQDQLLCQLDKVKSSHLARLWHVQLIANICCQKVKYVSATSMQFISLRQVQATIQKQV